MGNKKSITPEKIQEINRVIAEAMGYEIIGSDDDSIRVKPAPDHIWGWKLFNPYDSISDALEAVDVIIPRDKRMFIAQYSKYWKCSIWKGGRVDNTWSGEAETRPAAVSLALYEKIKEK